MCAFTPANILAAFAKTGIVPFNPDVVTEAMMGPSLETSITRHLPVALASPVQEIVDLISQHKAHKRKHLDDLEEVEPASKRHAADNSQTPQLKTPSRGSATSRLATQPTPTSTPYTPIQHGLNRLAMTSASFLVSPTPISSTSHLPAFRALRISQNIHRYDTLLTEEPATECEKHLMAALRESQEAYAAQKVVIMKMQEETMYSNVHMLKTLEGRYRGKRIRRVRQVRRVAYQRVMGKQRS